MTISGAGTPSATAIERAMKEFELQVSSQQVLQIQQYTKLLLAWNEKVNLTAIRDPLEILYRHFCESMYGATLQPVESVGWPTLVPGVASRACPSRFCVRAGTSS